MDVVLEFQESPPPSHATPGNALGITHTPVTPADITHTSVAPADIMHTLDTDTPVDTTHTPSDVMHTPVIPSDILLDTAHTLETFAQIPGTSVNKHTPRNAQSTPVRRPPKKRRAPAGNYMYQVCEVLNHLIMIDSTQWLQ